MILYAILLKFYWVTGGTDGISVRTPTLLGFVAPRDVLRLSYYYFTLVITGAVTYAVHRFLASPLGFFLKALADNEIRIEYSGASVQRVIYSTYVLSGALGGLAGVLVAFAVQDAYYTSLRGPNRQAMQDVADRVFEPLFSGKEGGQGMGLTIARSIVKVHGGEIQALTDGRRRGASIRILLPRKRSRATVH